MDLKSRSTPRAFNAIDPKILWFIWCYHSVFLLSEIFWEVLCSGKVMKTLWHQMEYWNVHSLFWGKLLLHRKWQHLVTLIERGQTFGFVMTKKFSDFFTLLYCRLCCSSRKCAGGEHACWSKDSESKFLLKVLRLWYRSALERFINHTCLTAISWNLWRF